LPEADVEACRDCRAVFEVCATVGRRAVTCGAILARRAGMSHVFKNITTGGL